MLLERMVADKGLRAQLRTGSLISGQLYVALDYFPDAPRARIDTTKEPPRIPGGSGENGRTSKTSSRAFFAKLEKMPVEEIGNDLRKTLETLDRTLQSADRTLTRVDAETLPEAKKTLEDLRRAVTAAERVLSNTDNTLLGPDAPAQQELRDALQEIARSARAIRLLADCSRAEPRNAPPREKQGESMMRRLASCVLLFALVVAGAGCASPRSNFYTLNCAAEPVTTGADNSGSLVPCPCPRRWTDRRRGAARPEQVAIDEFHRWASPLPDAIAQVVAENVAAMLGTPHVAVFLQPTAAGARYRVLVDVLGFEAAPGQAAARMRSGRCGARRTGRRARGDHGARTGSGPGERRLAAAHSPCPRPLTRTSPGRSGRCHPRGGRPRTKGAIATPFERDLCRHSCPTGGSRCGNRYFSQASR